MQRPGRRLKLTGLAGETEKDDGGTIYTNEIVARGTPDSVRKLLFRDSRDFVDH
jgi:hypothetical protein